MKNNTLKQQGFTLIELMIVVAIIGILSSIAFPSYQSYIRNTRAADAKGDLAELQSFMERKYSDDSSYCGNPAPGCTDAPQLPFNQSPPSGTAYYNIPNPTVTNNSFTLTATPTSTGGQNQQTCGSLSINNQNEKKHASGSANGWKC